MEIKKIDVNIGNIDTIYHIADIHIRNLKRHKEYRHVFKKLYKKIKEDTTNALILVAGDIVHSKLELSPESVDLVQDFFKNLCDLCPTIVITGNHDCNLNNSYRLDALKPIIDAIDNSNLIYLRESGVYKINNLHFTVMSVFDRPINFIKADSFQAEYKIALHHGAVDNAQTELGFKLSNKHVTTSIFDGYDITLLGDIHKRQFLNKEETIAYCGSLVQQNYGEDVSHGFLKWNLKTKKSEYIEIPNDYGYYTLEINKGKIVNPIEMSKMPRLRLRVQETDASDIKTILADLKTRYKFEDVIIQKINSNKGEFISSNGSKISFGDVLDPEYQNQLITKYIEDNFPGADEVILDGIRHINRTLNSKLPSLHKVRNVIWKPKKFTFSNMFSYGEDNCIDFTSMKGLYGLFASNASGKSTLFDALSFCCFDKCSRTNKASHILNNKKNGFECEFNFELNGKEYFIKRTATKQPSGHVRVDVEFWSIDDTGHLETLNGTERDDTNKNIKQYLGEYEDFILTALSLQNNNTGFIDKTQKERKELLSQFLDIDIFELLFQVASEEIKSVAVLLKSYQKEDFSTILAESEKNILKYSQKFNKLKIAQDELTNKLNSINQLILDNTSKLKVIEGDELNLESLKLNKTRIKDLIKTLNSKLSVVDNDISKSNSIQLKTQNKLSSYDLISINNNYSLLCSNESQLSNLKNSKELLKREIKHKLEKLEKLESHEYNPDCEFCKNNVFVKDAIATKKELELDKVKYEKFIDDESKLTSEIESLISVKSDKEVINELQNKLQEVSYILLQKQNERQKFESELKENDSLLLKTNIDIDKYLSNKNAIKHNERINKVIDSLNIKLNDNKKLLAEINNDVMHVHSDIKLSEKLKDDTLQSIATLKKLEQEYKGYEYYLTAVGRDGIPYQLISEAIPRIESEINNTLTQIVDFNITLQTDGKNINAFIVYDEGNYWPLELTSGMEKFVSQLAIRAALINISNLPRPNFLVIDEGFGQCDSQKLVQMAELFEYLKTQFDVVIVISHLDVMRDMVESFIELDKNEGFSKINYLP